ncbi:hypothetical protein [Dankookia rubra]|uniref:hypothetical protein n=1 Tax=Dankookia rubra TaxID=1442381 RepID=UPI00140C6FC5|nr:hypothetical protein [Dankookia rubra]
MHGHSSPMPRQHRSDAAAEARAARHGLDGRRISVVATFAPAAVTALPQAYGESTTKRL